MGRVKMFVQSSVFLLGLFPRLIIGDQLEMVQVIFRHGDRTPTTKELYPKLPYNPIYETLGYGQLTNIGKIREYRFGTLLRERYNDFLGNTHHHGDTYALSTDFARTKMSLQLVLSGLYPPTLNASSQIPVTPVPMMYLPQIVDTLMLPVFCPTYREEVRRIKNSIIIRIQLLKYNDLFQYLLENTGLDITSDPISVASRIHQFLSSQKALNLTLPKWATERVQRRIKEVVTLDYNIQSYTKKIQRLNGGMLVKEIIQNMNSKSNKSGAKIYLYSGHEINIAGFAKAHDLTEPQIPEYGSAIIVEKWRGQGGNKFIRMFLWTGITEKLISYKLPKCSIMCKYEKYIRLMQHVIPTTEEANCLWNKTTMDELYRYYGEIHH